MPDCPALDQLVSRQNDALVKEHLAQCSLCQTELALYQQFDAAQATPAEAADLAWVEAELAHRFPPPPKPRLRDWFRISFTPARLSFAGAALVVLVAAGVFLRPGDLGRSPAPESPVVWRSVQFRATAPIGDLDTAPSHLAWEAVPGARSFHVRLLEVDGTEIWAADTPSSPIALPPDIRAQFTGGRAFQWDAAALDSAGRPIASTNLQSFHILATPR